jgi:hypothetical protein
MASTLDQIRAKLQALDTRKTQGSGDKTIYTHWDIPEGTSTILRFAPDANLDNTFFWTERQLINLDFAGIKGQDEHKKVIVKVPCIEMWDGKMTCPILNEVRPWWKDASLEATARKYWCKRTYFMQGFVKQDPMNETDSPENPIRKFVIGPQLFAIIKAALMDPDMENSPVDYINGTDFIVSKTSKGGYADYGTSKWARKESSLSEDMMEAVDKYGLVDLATYLPKRPTPEQMAIIFDMFQDSLEGELYDPAKFSQHFKPYGFDSGTNGSGDADGGEGKRVTRAAPQPTRTQIPTTKPVVSDPITEDDVEQFESSLNSPKTEVKETVATVTAGKSPQEILAMLRNRNK